MSVTESKQFTLTMSQLSRIVLASILFMMFCFAKQSLAQTNSSPSNKVIAAFDQNELALKSSDEIQWMNFVASEGYFIKELENKGQGFPDLKELDPNITPENINPYLLGILHGEAHQYYLIGNTSYVVIFLLLGTTQNASRSSIG